MTRSRSKTGTLLALVLSLVFTLAVSGSGLGPAALQADARPADLPSGLSQERPAGQGPGVFPSSGPPGTQITVRGAGFRSFAAVESITLGGRNILGSRTVNTDGNGEFEVTDLVVPGLDPGIVALTVRVGTGDLETTAVGAFRVTAADSAVATPVAEALAPLGAALVRVFHFDNNTKAWRFYDPRPAFYSADIIDEIVDGRVYWIKVTRDITVNLNARQRELTCARQGTPQEDCWNLIVW